MKTPKIHESEESAARAVAGSSYNMATANTGNLLVVFPEGFSPKDAAKALGSAKVTTAMSSDFSKTKPVDIGLGKEADALVFEEVGACVVHADAIGQVMATLNSTKGHNGFIVEPERYVRAFAMEQYLQGYQDGVSDVTKRILAQTEAGETVVAAVTPKIEEAVATWGLQMTNVVNSRYTGKGIRVAVLDTGFATQHPDYNNRGVITKVFTGEPSVEDVQGHGTHCIGTAAGPCKPSSGPRYGVACEAEIYAGKVLNNSGSGGDRGIIGGIEWAVLNKCAVVSMSLGAPVYAPGYSVGFETIARRVLRAGTLIIAAAGNESYRPQTISPVAHPANCPSIMAVGAIDSAMRMAYFSCGGVYGGGGEVDIAGPGVNVYSSWPPSLGRSYHVISGTSMATPHVAGIAALFAESNSNLRGKDLWNALISKAKRLNSPPRDVGAGLVQAP